MPVEINYLAVIVAAIASMVLGGLWYGPLFGKQWIKWMKWSKKDVEKAKKKGMGKSYAIAIVASLIMADVLAYFIEVLRIYNVAGAIELAFWVWLGFIATTSISACIWEGKSYKLWGLFNAYSLVSLSVMSIIITSWI